MQIHDKTLDVKTNLKTLTLLKSKAQPVWAGHPWVFQKAFDPNHAPQETPVSGELVLVEDAAHVPIGVGIYNATSLYRVRMLSRMSENLKTLPEILDRRIQQAIQLRTHLNLPNPDTQAYRLINSEGDGLSGLTVDLYGEILVISSSAYWVEAYKNLISERLQFHTGLKTLLWRPQEKSLLQDGWIAASHADAPALSPPVQHTQQIHQIRESGLIYQIDFGRSQKTGFFFDQRENRVEIAKLAQGKRVLDLYCYVGGFALHAAQAGARYVLGIDSSASAIESAKNHATLNQLSQIEFQCRDATQALAEARDYDLVILDPPKLVPSRTHLSQAMRYAQNLHRQVLEAMKPGSFLLTCSCSSAISQAHWVEMLRNVGTSLKRSIQILKYLGAAPDHPTLPAFPEGQYLHGILLVIH